jgi:hypothetical protein
MLLLHYPLLDKTLAILAVVLRGKLGAQRPRNSHAVAVTERQRRKCGMVISG